MMKEAVLLAALLIFVSTINFPIHTPFVKHYHNRLYSRKPSMICDAFGNFKLNDLKMKEDKNEIQQAEVALGAISNQHNLRRINGKMEYCMEYYMDSSMNTVAYVLFKTNGTQITKYSALMDRDTNRVYQMGSQPGPGQECGYEMLLRNYTHIDYQANPAMTNLFLKEVATNTRIVYSPANVRELKYWSFSGGNYFLFLCQNGNRSLSYYTFVNSSSKLTYLSSSYVPPHILSRPMDYLTTSRSILMFLNGIYGQSPFKNQKIVMSDIEFFEIFMDPFIDNVLNIMITFSNRNMERDDFKSNYTRYMGMAFPMKVYTKSFQSLRLKNSRSSNKRNAKAQVACFHEYNYSHPGNNRFHNKSYFNNNDYDRRIGYGGITVNEKKTYQRLNNSRTTGLAFRVTYPGVRLFTIWKRYINDTLSAQHKIMLWCFQGSYRNRESLGLTQNLYGKQKYPLTDQNMTKAIQDFDAYKFSELLPSAKNSVRARLMRVPNQMCKLNDIFELTFFSIAYSYHRTYCVIRADKLRSLKTGHIFQLGDAKVGPSKFAKRTWGPNCKVIDICQHVKLTPLSLGESEEFFSEAEWLLSNPRNGGITMANVKKIEKLNGKEMGRDDDTWIVYTEKGGVKRQYIIAHDRQKNPIILGVSDDSRFSHTKGQGANSNGHKNNNLPLTGSASGIPNYSLKGNGDINKKIVDEIYPILMEHVSTNAQGTCTNINNIDYFVDPLSKINAFVLTCPENNGQIIAYEIVYLPEKNQSYFMGYQTLQSLPKEYWSIKATQPSKLLVAAVESSVKSTFARGIVLKSILFVNELNFVKGFFDFIGFELNDGSKMQGEFLCFGNGTCQKIVENVVEMGTGKPPVDNGANKSGAQGSGNQNGGQTNGQNSGQSNQNQAQNNNNNQNSGSSGGINTGGFDFGSIFGTSPAKKLITYSALSPPEVRSDPYIIPIYQALLPNLPNSLTSLQVNKIEKGIYSNNGTIGYKIFFGPNHQENTFCLTIFFDPKPNRITFLDLSKVQKAPELTFAFMNGGTTQGQTSYTQQSTKNANSNTNSHTHSQTSSSTSSSTVVSKQSGGGCPYHSTVGSDPSSQAMIRKIFTSWASSHHPELRSAHQTSLKMEITNEKAICTMIFSSKSGNYKIQLEMSMRTNQIREISFVKQ